jgi:hypothetical protein
LGQPVGNIDKPAKRKIGGPGGTTLEKHQRQNGRQLFGCRVLLSGKTPPSIRTGITPAPCSMERLRFTCSMA